MAHGGQLQHAIEGKASATALQAAALVLCKISKCAHTTHVRDVPTVSRESHFDLCTQRKGAKKRRPESSEKVRWQWVHFLGGNGDERVF